MSLAYYIGLWALVTEAQVLKVIMRKGENMALAAASQGSISGQHEASGSTVSLACCVNGDACLLDQLDLCALLCR